MANRRMFSLRIINSARFLKMPIDSQVLYFHLGMNADDDGVVEAYPVMRMLGNTEDNLKVLVAKNFVKILNEDLVSLISDWTEHNLIRADRKVDSIYKDLLLQIVPDIQLIEPKPRADTGVVRKPTQSQIRGSVKYLPSNFKARILPYFNGKSCPVCNNKMFFPGVPQGGGNQTSIQHNRRISQGGEHRIENISIICFECNMKLKNQNTQELNNKEVVEIWDRINPKSNGRQMDAIGKDRLGKDSKDKDIAEQSSAEGILSKEKEAEGNAGGTPPKEPPKYDFKDSLSKMEKDSRRHINIIALYWKFKGIAPENKQQYEALLKRELRPAQNLVGFSDDRILEVMDWLEVENDFKFSLETVMKFITEDLGSIAPIKAKKYRY